jgi:potassium-transporting ATPase KdpC subunit
MLAQFRPALLLTLVLTAVTGLVYPFTVTVLAQMLFHSKANGSLITRDGHVIGSRLIGQNFAAPQYFHGRPSATGSNSYNAAGSGGSNWGPTNPDLAKRISNDAVAYRTANGVRGNLSSDALTTAGSGLDPEVSPANALLRVKRVARARHCSEQQLESLVNSHVQGRGLAVFGEPRVNVLELNLALDQSFPFTNYCNFLVVIGHSGNDETSLWRPGQ